MAKPVQSPVLLRNCNSENPLKSQVARQMSVLPHSRNKEVGTRQNSLGEPLSIAAGIFC
jgi:hypothetical protein